MCPIFDTKITCHLSGQFELDVKGVTHGYKVKKNLIIRA